MNKEIQYRILVVDDNKNNIQVLGNILHKANYMVGFAFNGEQAINILKTDNEYDLVLLDIDMPVMNGYETCKFIRNDSSLKDLAIIFLTAYNDTEKIIQGFEIGAQDYVTKPFNQQELLARVKTQLQIIQKSREISKYAKRLEILNATKNKFFSIISHDLRNPFAGMIGIIDLLKNNYKEIEHDRIENLLGILYDSTKQTHSLLENLLIWSQCQTGRIKYEPKDIEIMKMAENCVTIVKFQSQNKNITVINNIPDSMIIRGDSYQITTILLNLLTNAVKYTPKNGTITISAKAKDQHYEISIVDTGIGMTKDLIEKLFRIEANIPSTPGTENEMGTGLGLILTKEFITQHGGIISAKSQPEKGTTMTFSLPIEIKD
jgi:signal transduction histidine kinase